MISNAANPARILVTTDFSPGAACAFPYATALARDIGELTLLGPDYPRVFFFRASEAACSPRAYPTYEDWERNFNGLMGIMGKCLAIMTDGRNQSGMNHLSVFPLSWQGRIFRKERFLMH